MAGKRVKRIIFVCEECGKTFDVLPSAAKARPCRFCSHLCACRNNSKGEALKKHRREHKAPWLRKLNQTPGRNKKIAQDNKDKIRSNQPTLGKFNGRTYAKLYGRHAHRVVAEKMLGRPLNPNEVVHHIDRNIRNNDPSNLQVMSRIAHTALHSTKGGDAKCSIAQVAC